MSDRPHEQLCQALEQLMGYSEPTQKSAANLLAQATYKWHRAAAYEIYLRPERDRIIQLAHKHGLDTNTITQAIGQLPDGRQLLAHTTVQHLTKTAKSTQ